MTTFIVICIFLGIIATIANLVIDAVECDE